LQFNFFDVDKSLDKKYAIEVPKLRYGLNEETFHIDRSFFQAFEYSPIQEGDLTVHVAITRFSTHLDAKFHFKGTVTLECDRCMEPYPHSMEFLQRIVYSFDASLDFDTDEVVLLDESVPVIHLVTDFYDFIVLEIPFRKVPEAEIHLCDAKVLELLNLNPDGSERAPIEGGEDEENLDPRWLALKKLNDSQEIEQ
jgi:uncharacterized protein